MGRSAGLVSGRRKLPQKQPMRACILPVAGMQKTPTNTIYQCLPTNFNGFSGAAHPGKDLTNTIFSMPSKQFQHSPGRGPPQKRRPQIEYSQCLPSSFNGFSGATHPGRDAYKHHLLNAFQAVSMIPGARPTPEETPTNTIFAMPSKQFQ